MKLAFNSLKKRNKNLINKITSKFNNLKNNNNSINNYNKN